MKIIKTVNGKSPQIPQDCYVAENATIVGDVTFGHSCSVWFNAVIRGDVNSITIGTKSISKMVQLFIVRIKNMLQQLETMCRLVITPLFTAVSFMIMF